MAKGGDFWSLSSSGGAAHIFSHAMAGGILSVVQGGKFGNAFFSAGLTKGFDSQFNISGDGAAAFFGETVVVAGGTISQLTGGKFANGASTAAFQHLFNELATMVENNRMQAAQQTAQYKKAMYLKAEKDMASIKAGANVVEKTAHYINVGSTAAIPVSLSFPLLYPAVPFLSGTSAVSGSVEFGAQLVQKDWGGAAESVGVTIVSTAMGAATHRFATSPAQLAVPAVTETVYNGWDMFIRKDNGN